MAVQWFRLRRKRIRFGQFKAARLDWRSLFASSCLSFPSHYGVWLLIRHAPSQSHPLRHFCPSLGIFRPIMPQPTSPFLHQPSGTRITKVKIALLRSIMSSNVSESRARTRDAFRCPMGRIPELATEDCFSSKSFCHTDGCKPICSKLR
jgi:hypothetical protein